MKKSIHYSSLAVIITGIIILLTTSCKSESQPLLPTVSGRAGEVVVVMEEFRWESELGDTLRDIFEKEMIALPNPEPSFNLIHVPPDGFKKIFQSNRTILMVKISPEYTEPKITVQRNLYARPQYIFNLIAPTGEAAIEYIGNNHEKLMARVLTADRVRIINTYEKNLDQKIFKELKKEHELTLLVPKGYSLDMDSSNFVWISNELAESSQGIFIYYYPYTDPDAFEVDNLLDKRDAFLKKNVMGPNAGSYMTTERRFYTVKKEFLLKERYFVELRGLWKLENGFMGGPFVSLTTLDEENNRVVTVEGFVYAPKGRKRNLLRQVEAILYTLNFPGEENEE